jgi:DNA polymerase I-like protein with 3'-5' exonuclease and polymerase domains
MTKLKIIRSDKELNRLISYCRKTKYACVDFEASLKYYNDNVEMYNGANINEPWIMGCSFQPGSAYIIPMEHPESPWKGGKWRPRFKKFCKKVLHNPDIVKVAWNFKFEMKWFKRYGFTPEGRVFDAMLAKYCLDEERPHGLKEFVSNYFPERAGYQKKLGDLQQKKNHIPSYKDPFDKLSYYCGEDCDLTLQGFIHLERKCMDGGYYNLFRNLLMMCTRVMTDSEYSGARIDKAYVESLLIKYVVKIKAAEERLRKDKYLLKYELNKKREVNSQLIKAIQLDIKKVEQGDSRQKERMIRDRRQKIQDIQRGKYHGKGTYEQFNFRSPPQLAQFFFTSDYGMGWRVIDKTEKGAPSTAEGTLKKYEKKDKSGFVKKLLDYRELEHLNSTYIEGILRQLDHYDRVHSSFLIHGTVTGRLSSVEPNLQNIPRDTTASDIKRMYVPPPGFVLLEVDYSQAELRIVAELSGDANLIDIFRRNYNVHVATACRMFATIEQYDEVKNILKDDKHPKWLEWEKNKKKGKSMNFSILYLQGDEATAEGLGVTVEEARKFKKKWFQQFPGVKKWIDKQISLAHKQGYVPNLFGRKRRLHDIDSSKQFLVAECERQSVNAPIQGTSGDFGLFSEIIIREKILKGEFPTDMTQVYRVHDSLGIYIRPKDVHKVIGPIMKICDNPETMKYFGFELKHVRMKVSPEVGIHWAALKEYDQWANYNNLLLTEEYKKIYPWYDHSLSMTA